MRLIMALALVAATALAGCSDADGDDFVTPEQDDQGRYVIKMVGTKFLPENAVVPVNATVVWVNESGAHNTVSKDGLWDSGKASGDKGEHFEFTFDEAGTHEYHCEPHRSVGMTGTVRVE